ncbi:MAG: hypothetical protein J0L73_21660 [Verrucomicrobia bacterium]|nr:hypothetical protein [Verrucomicrobiota bacterium]
MIPIQISITSNSTSPWVELFKTAGPFIGAWIGTGIAGWMAIRAYRTNQWWDMRSKMYAKVVECMHNCSESCRVHCNALRAEFNEIDFIDTNSTANNYSIASKNLVSLISQGRFSMSDEALKLLVNLVEEIRTIFKGEEPDFAKFHETQRLVDRKITSFSHVAKDDLQVYPTRNQLAKIWSRTTRLGLRWIHSICKNLKLTVYIVCFGEQKGRAMLSPDSSGR